LEIQPHGREFSLCVNLGTLLNKYFEAEALEGSFLLRFVA